ncbi:hypothetical protein HXX76_007387 [Chlamydomonas incerta]|uniref:Protein kinase domain-containing protein n=1 Tax=Chlamydomonas incerta TaxID=51695 RepID=A0A835VZS4_CHLIN|nr:hypothetical protein HXX76_007387 [Chlamydomonas incerta]|eukprot:KAG2435312.1 hypothetical protein HXX76_007387 [Chlamydomonas incerta]
MQALVHLQRELSLTAGHSLLARTERVLGVLCSFLSASDIRLYGAVDTDEHPGAAPFILIASSGAPPVATATAPTSPSLRGAAAPLAPGTEAWPASMMPVAIATAGASRSQLPIGGSGGCDGGSCAALEMDEHSLGIGELPTPGALRASLPRALAPAQQAASFKMLRQHETQAGRPSVACTGRSQQHPAAGAALPSPQSQLGVRLTPPEPLPALLDRMLQTQAPVFSTRPAPEAPTGGGGGVRGSASGDTAGAAEGDVVILIPLTSGRRILGALWVVRYSGVAATLAAAAAAAAAAASAAASAATATSSGVGATSSPQVPQAGATTSGRAVLEFSRRMQQAPVAAPVVVNTTIGGAGALSFATSSSIPSSGPALLASPPPPALPPAAACYNLLTSPMALQQLSMSLSLLLGADAAPLAGLAGCLAALAGAASVTSLVGALADALAAHVRERYLLEPRVVAAYVPEPSSAVGLLFGGGGGGGAGRNGHGSLAFGGAADAVETAAGAVLSGHHAKDSFKQPPSTQGNAAASKVAGMDARRAGAAAAARVAQIVDGAATRVRSETTARQIRRVPAGSFAADASGGGGGGGRGGGSSFQHGTASSRALATHADLCFPDPLMYSGGNAVFATGPGGYGSNRGPAVAGGLGTAASASRVVALSNVDVAAIDATAAAGSGVTTVRVKPFPLNNTLLRQLVRKQAADTAAAAAKLQQQPRQQAQQQPSAVASSSSGGGNDARAAARGAAAVEVPDCAAHMQDARMPSRDLLMLLTSLSAAAGGAAIGGGAPSSAASVLAGAGASGSAAFVGHSMSQSQLTTQQQRSGPYGSGGGMGGGGGLRSLLLVALPAGDGRGVLAFYVAFPQQLPPPLLREIRGALSEVLDCASALVARKVSRELAAELETLATAAPGASYAVVQDHRVPELVDPEHGTGRGGGGNQEPMTAPANVVGSPAGGGSGSSMSAAFASSAAGLRGLAAGARSVGGMRAGGGGGGGGGGGTGTGGGGGGHTSTAIPEDATDRLDPLLASLEPAFLYETGRTDRSGGEGEGGRFGRTNSAALHAAGGAIALLDASGSARGARRPGAAEAPGTPTAGSRAASGNVGRVALAMLAAANATAGGGAAESAEMAALSPFRGGNQNGGMMPPACGSPGVNEAGLLLLGPMPPSGCPGMYTRSTSVVHMEEMDPVQSTMRAQLPLLVASLQTSISNARSEAALLQAAATALLPRSGPIAVVPSHGGGGGSSGAVPMASAASGPAGVSGRQSHLAPSNGPSHAAGQSDMDQLQLVSQLGVGGCAVVFKGRLGTLDCAVKLMEMPDVDEELRPATGMTGSTHVSGDALTGGAVAPQAAAGGEAAAAAAADEEAAERERVMARRAMLRNAMELAAMQMISHPNVMQAAAADFGWSRCPPSSLVLVVGGVDDWAGEDVSSSLIVTPLDAEPACSGVSGSCSMADGGMPSAAVTGDHGGSSSTSTFGYSAAHSGISSSSPSGSAAPSLGAGSCQLNHSYRAVFRDFAGGSNSSSAGAGVSSSSSGSAGPAGSGGRVFVVCGGSSRGDVLSPNARGSGGSAASGSAGGATMSAAASDVPVIDSGTFAHITPHRHLLHDFARGSRDQQFSAISFGGGRSLRSFTAAAAGAATSAAAACAALWRLRPVQQPLGGGRLRCLMAAAGGADTSGGGRRRCLMAAAGGAASPATMDCAAFAAAAACAALWQQRPAQPAGDCSLRKFLAVHSTFTNVTLGRRAAPDGAEHFFLRPAGEMELSPEAPPICVAIVCEWCDQACLATALHKRVFPVTLGRLAPTAQNPRGPRVYDFKGIMMTLLDVAMALRHLHANHLIHRDIKPANILLKTNTMDRRGFTAKLADFGFVTLLNRPGDELSGGEPFVAVEESCGTVTHMAPECWSKPCRLDASCDVYSFGILMWELLAGGVRPYPEIEPQDIRKHVCKGLRPVFEGAVPAPYKQLAQRCWSADPLQRPRSSELVAAISQLLSTIGGGGGGGGGGAAGR